MHGGEKALGADPRVVDEAVNGAEFVAQSLHERRDGVGLAEIEGPEVEAAGALFGHFTDGFAQRVALAPRHRDHIVAGSS